MHTKLHLCHVCNTTAVDSFPEFTSLCRVASDCRPWPSGGQLGVCQACGNVQKIINDAWRTEVSKIYSDYNLYHQSTGGKEQPVFDQDTGKPSPRSEKVLNFAIAAAQLSSTGQMMDVGCGTGAMLRAFSNVLPSWELNGFEPNLNQPEKVFSIPGVKNVFSGQLNDVKHTFDLISVIHALEHIENPVPFLKTVSNKLNANGILLIEVPYFPDNPFDLLIADHCTHFTVDTLLAVLSAAGLQAISIKTDVIDKEISVVAKRTDNNTDDTVTIAPNVIVENTHITKVCISWLKEVLLDARNIASNGNFGLFGTSISANWLLGELENSISFFLEEDNSRIGKLYHNRPVYQPTDAPKGSHVYMALPRFLAAKIAQRLEIQNVKFHLPPMIV